MYNNTFGGIGRLYTSTGLNRLKESHVCVVGIGGVGSWAAEALVRSGVGQITLIDMDELCITNINRQLPALVNTVGKLKVEVMAQRLALINPECQINQILEYITPSNIEQYIVPEFDYVIDCIDSVFTKTALIAFCSRKKIRVVTTGAAGGKIDPTMVQIGDVNKVHNDPLIRKVRSRLRSHYSFSRNAARTYSIPCVYSTEQLLYPYPDGSVSYAKPPIKDSQKLDCGGGVGSSTMITGTFGFVAASRVIQRISGKMGKKS
jgi:tRNA A37 threonylcarbamoyladenosine dehydratase